MPAAPKLNSKEAEMTALAPSLFISHGSPMFALEPGPLGAALARVCPKQDSWRAMIVVSPHWSSRASLQVSANPKPVTIHDFSGFARSLYSIDYPAPGDPDLAQQIVEDLTAVGFTATTDPNQGMDHGVWVPLRYLRPEADIPVISVSLPDQSNPAFVLKLGRALSKWRTQKVAIIGSGSMTHNLGEFRGSQTTAVQPYVKAFTDWVHQAVYDRDFDRLLNYRTLAPDAQRSHPTDEHFLPLFVALGASHQTDTCQTLSDEVRYGMLSMASYLWSATPSD